MTANRFTVILSTEIALRTGAKTRGRYLNNSLIPPRLPIRLLAS
ncbi:hypothetical protein Prede_0838 [Prevotella dentalis DSM 3688]|uniref:Uncharacterized protein n=1 Tax=Prevotella dentalis (strain ATCC 49559 / DSM 3688 / JCM 13448 / NCTC 12043 / ES 2772) TaxID=908937 RepID=L0JC51_PREDD|nr:hypothetical protein Prede_0838 [Prevotella dentalis DSM 3688]